MIPEVSEAKELIRIEISPDCYLLDDRYCTMN